MTDEQKELIDFWNQQIADAEAIKQDAIAKRDALLLEFLPHFVFLPTKELYALEFAEFVSDTSCGKEYNETEYYTTAWHSNMKDVIDILKSDDRYELLQWLVYDGMTNTIYAWSWKNGIYESELAKRWTDVTKHLNTQPKVVVCTSIDDITR